MNQLKKLKTFNNAKIIRIMQKEQMQNEVQN